LNEEAPAGEMFRARRRGGGRGFDPYAIMMLLRVGQQLAQHINGGGREDVGGGIGGRRGGGDPPVATIGLVVLMLASHFAPDLADLGLLPRRLAAVVAPPLQDVCMQPRLIVEGPGAASSWLRAAAAGGRAKGGGGGLPLVFGGRGWYRLIASAFVHADMSHLAYNVSSLLWKGALLEPGLGPARTLALLLELLLLSHGLCVASAFALARQPGAGALLRAAPWLRPLLRSLARDIGWPLYAHSCAVGCSAVLFALKIVVPSQGQQGGWAGLGARVPARHAAWLELGLASLVNPGLAPFAAHLSGICAGLLHVRVLAPAWRAFLEGGGGGGGGVGGRGGGGGGGGGIGGVGGRFGATAMRQPRERDSGQRAAAAATEAAAAAAEARRRAAELRGRPAARQQEQQQQQAAPPLSAEGLRERRIRRLGG